MKLDSEWKDIVVRCKELLPKLLTRKMEVEAELSAIDSQVERMKAAGEAQANIALLETDKPPQEPPGDEK